MHCMFSNAQLFNSDMSKWDVSSVQNMDVVFLGTASLADVVCVIVPLVSANVSLPSLMKGVAEPLSPSGDGQCRTDSNSFYYIDQTPKVPAIETQSRDRRPASYKTDYKNWFTSEYLNLLTELIVICSGVPDTRSWLHVTTRRCVWTHYTTTSKCSYIIR